MENESSVIKNDTASQSILYQSCDAGHFGKKIEYPDGAVYEGGFIYLLGKPNQKYVEQLDKLWHYRMFVCLSKEWEEEILSVYPGLIHTQRYVMEAKTKKLDSDLLHKFVTTIPKSYRLAAFDESAYDQKPFGHGANYETYRKFHDLGAGVVAYYGDDIVSSASSFLTYQNQVELNVSTRKEHRKKGLGLAVSAAMILECKKKELEVHWDAQNIVSRRMAESIGFQFHSSYMGYSFVPPNEP